MGIFDWLRNRISKRADARSRSANYDVDRFIVSNVIVNCTDSNADPEKVLKAFGQLKGMLGENRLQLLALVPEAYPHLEAMTNTEPQSTTWLTAFSDALAAAADNAERVAEEQAEVAAALGELREYRSKDDR